MMIPKIQKNTDSKDGLLKFTLSDVNVSLANGLRRTIISDIPTVVFKTLPYEENKCNITVNTTRFNNEILKQRLSCVPIHITDLSIPLKDYKLEVNVENLTNDIIYVTTEDFKIRNVNTNEYLDEKDTRNIFPANDLTGYFIDFARLRPRISDEIPGEKISLTCDFSIGTAKEDGMFNVISKCAYGCTQDTGSRYMDALEKKRQEWKDSGFDESQIKYAETDWKLLDGKRIIKKDSFDFVIKTVGVYTNEEIVIKACEILMKELIKIHDDIETDKIDIEPSITTIQNSYDIVLPQVTSTIGPIIQNLLYLKFFEELKTMTFCGFEIAHPHDVHSTLRIAYKENVDKSVIKQNIISSIDEAVNVYKEIKRSFTIEKRTTK
jgi:DNA-directed RNA polymerase II subunit RPB3